MRKIAKSFACFAIVGSIILACTAVPTYASSNEPPFGIEPWFVPIDFPVDGGPLNLSDFDLGFVPSQEYPHFNGVPPLEVPQGWPFNEFRELVQQRDFSCNTYEITASSNIVPEPATLLLFGLGGLMLRKIRV